jgi:ankyrin repeat protein/predicted aspartyl protease
MHRFLRVLFFRSIVTAAAVLTAESCFAATTTPADGGMVFPAGQDSVTVRLVRVAEQFGMPVTIGGKDAGIFILDTGASYGVVDTALAEKLKLPLLGDGRITTATTVATVHYRTVRRLETCGMNFDERTVAETDFSKIFGVVKRPVSGIIGNDVLSRLVYTLDFQTGTITFYKPGSFRPPAGDPGFALRDKTHTPAVRASVNGQAEGWFLVDTGATGTTLCPLGEHLLPELRRASTLVLNISTGMGETQIGIETAMRFNVFGREMKVQATFPPPQEVPVGMTELGFLGRDVLDDLQLTVDQRGGRVYAKWLPKLSPEAWVKDAGDPLAKDAVGQTPLMRATAENRLDVVKLLLAAGAKADASNMMGRTALFGAADHGNLDMVELLLQHGAPVDLVKGSSDYCRSGTPLQHAAQYGHAAVVARLLKAGAAPDGLDTFGRSPLGQASLAGEAECVKLLLAAGASVNAAIAKNKTTPLHLAAWGGHPEIIEQLLAASADPAARDNEGKTPLHLAAFLGRVSAVEALLKARTPVDATSTDGRTPLMLAALNREADIAEKLLAAGADRAAADNGGHTVADYATMGGSLEVLKMLAPPPRGAPAGNSATGP